MSTATTKTNPEEVKSGQNVVKQGLLKKAGDRWGIRWNERWTVLQAYPSGRHYYLYRYKSKGEQTNPTSSTKIDYSTEIGTFKDEDSDKDLVFYIENKKTKEKFQFKATSKEEMVEWIKCIKNAILAAYSPDDDSKEEKKEGEDALSEWLTYFGLIRYDVGLREAGLDDFELVKTLTDDDISGFATEVTMKTFHKKKFNEAISKVKNGDYKSSEVVDPEILNLREGRKELQGKVKRDEDANDIIVNDGKKTRNIIFIGETGAGKTTLINSMINHLECVSYTEPFRYNLIMESKDDDVDKNEAKSQTKKITKYHLKNLPAIDYNLNVIDTPGFGDTNGPQQDIVVRNMFKTFFETIDAIDGVYFVLKSSDTRLTGTQQYIFDMVLNVFGADIKDNIFILFTFADGAIPPVLKVVNQIDVFKDQMPQHFKINNSGFGLPGKYDLTHENFFKTGNEQFKIIFEALSKTESKSIANTLETLTQRENLTTWLFNIGQHVKASLDRKKAMDTSMEYLKANKDKADANKDFKYPDEEVDIIYDKTLVKPGKYTTYCPKCISTCHKNCGIKDDGEKYRCWAMTAGVCGQCKGKCDWNIHRNEPYVVRRETKIVWKTKKQMAKKYKLAAKAMVKHTDIMKAKKEEIKQLEIHIMKTIEKMREAVNILEDVALNKKVLTPNQYFDTLIASEENNGEEGWQDRVKALEKMKTNNELLRNIVENDDEKVFQQVMITDMDKYDCNLNIPQAPVHININNYNIKVNQHIANVATSQSGVVATSQSGVVASIMGVSFGATTAAGFFFKKNKGGK